MGETFEVLQVLRVGAGSRPHVARISYDGRQCVIKDHQGCDPWFARLFGPLLARREISALKKLTELNGIPNLVTIVNKRAFIMTWIEARPYRLVNLTSEGWSEFFSQLELLVAKMHKQGVAHGDMRSPDNTLIDKTDAPVLVDFVGSVLRGPSWNIWNRWLFSRLCLVDLSAITKQKTHVAPWLLTKNAETSHQQGWIGLIGRKFGQIVRRITRFLFTRAN